MYFITCRLGRYKGLSKKKVGKVVIYGVIYGSRALDLIDGDGVGTESFGNVNTNLLRSDTAEVKCEIGAVKTVLYDLFIGCTADYGSPLTERVNLNFKSCSHEGSGGSCGIEVVNLELVEEIAAAKIDNTVKYLPRIRGLGREASCLIVCIIIGKLSVVVVDANAAVSSHEERGSTVARLKHLTFKNVCNTLKST